MKRKNTRRKEKIINGFVVPHSIEAQRDLANFLNEMFKTRLTMAITNKLINRWKRSQGLGQVAIEGKLVSPPPFPDRHENRRTFDVPLCVRWVEDWIVPQKKVNGSNGHGTAQEFEDIEKEHAIWKMKREREISEGEYKSVSVFNEHLMAIGLSVNRAVNSSEKRMQSTIVTAVKSKLPDEQLLPVITQSINDGVRASVDGLRASIVEALTKARETKTKRK